MQNVPGHYRVFTGAASFLWTGINPYGNDYGTGVGYYFYSPSCGLFLFGLFSWLPEKFGIFLYIALSWSVFVWGSISFAHAYRLKDSKIFQWYWLAIAFQMYTGILTSKVEILMTGMLLLCASWLIEGKRKYTCALLLSMILNWKFQPLPSIGLILLCWWILKRDWKWPASFLCFLGLWYILPFLFVPFSTLIEAHSQWRSTLVQFVQEAYLNFENIYTFGKNSLGTILTFPQAQALSLAAGFAFGVATLIWIIKHRNFPGGVLFSLALGATYTCVFSPLGQNNALINYAPLLLAGFITAERTGPFLRNIWLIVLVATVSVLSLAYSDVVPHLIQEQIRHATIKPLACLVLGLFFIYSMLRFPHGIR